MENFKLHIAVYETAGNSTDERVPVLELDDLPAQSSLLEAGKEMLRKIRDLKDDNPGRPLKFDALITDGAGNLITVFSDD